MKRIILAALTLVFASGCLALDGFLYTTKRLDSYEFVAEGETAEETVTPDQIEPLEIPVEEDAMGAVWVRAAQQPPRAYVLYFQGQGGNIVETFPRIKRLANMGYDVLAIDYRGWGGSTNIAPTEDSIEADAREAHREFLTRAKTGKIIYYGRSFGSCVATYLATQQAPEVLILESPLASIEALGRDSSGGLPLPTGFFSNSSWDSVGRIGGIDTALLMLHGTADDYVRYEFSEQLLEAAKEPKKLITVEDADHGDIPERMGARFAEEIQSFVNAHVP